MPDADIRGRELAVPRGCHPYNNEIGPEILRASRGSGLRLPCDRGAAAGDADADGVLPHGVRASQAAVVSGGEQRQPARPVEPVSHIAGAAVSREHGGEAEAHQDPDLA